MTAINMARLWLLYWRVWRGSPLPAVAMVVLRWLDRLALRLAERATDKPWTPAASARIDHMLDRDR